MKTRLIALLLLLNAEAVTYAQTGTHQVYTQKSANKIIVTDANSKQLLNQVKAGKAYLVDVRTPQEYSAGHLQYAQNINLRSADFGRLVNQLDKSKVIYLYCHSGNRSGKATDSLLTLGYGQSYNLGALDSIINAGFPLAQPNH